MIAQKTSDAYIFRIAASVARSASDDPRTQNAAVLSRRDDIIVASANAIPAGIKKSDARLAAPRKYEFIEHAERAVIYRAAWCGWKTSGARLYCLWVACPDCARAIIQSGVQEVVTLESTRDLTPERWRKAVEVGVKMLAEAGVPVRYFSGAIGETIVFDGKEVRL